MNCYYCGKLLGNTDPKPPTPTDHPTLIRCAGCDVDYGYVLEHQQRPLLNLLTKVMRNPVQDPVPPLPESIATAIARMPERFYLQCRVERGEDGKPFLSAAVMETPPEGGWQTLADCFGSPGYTENPRTLAMHAHDEACRVGVSASLDDPQSFERLILSMLRARWPQESAP